MFDAGFFFGRSSAVFAAEAGNTVCFYSMTPDQLSRGFFCPLCRSNHLKLVGVRSSKTGRFTIVDGLYQCAGCSAVFTDPGAFTQLVQDTIVDAPHHRERRPTREYPPDALTTWRGRSVPSGRESEE